MGNGAKGTVGSIQRTCLVLIPSWVEIFLDFIRGSIVFHDVEHVIKLVKSILGNDCPMLVSGA